MGELKLEKQMRLKTSIAWIVMKKVDNANIRDKNGKHFIRSKQKSVRTVKVNIFVKNKENKTKKKESKDLLIYCKRMILHQNLRCLKKKMLLLLIRLVMILNFLELINLRFFKKEEIGENITLCK